MYSKEDFDVGTFFRVVGGNFKQNYGLYNKCSYTPVPPYNDFVFSPLINSA